MDGSRSILYLLVHESKQGMPIVVPNKEKPAEAGFSFSA